MIRGLRRICAVTGVAVAGIAALACTSRADGGRDRCARMSRVLTDSISQIVAGCPAEVGVAVIVNDIDTAVVNNRSIYPMMSVFKLHQALAVCDMFDRDGISLDTMLTLQRDKLDAKTWSPMLKEHRGDTITLPVTQLLRYSLTQSDNNASNVMFGRLVGVAATDSFIATIIPRPDFRIAYTESEMSADHARAYANYTSPLGAAMLMNRLFADSLVSGEKQNFIKRTLGECVTGKDRIAAPLIGKKGVTVAHKTGSGYTDNGILAAHNDVAYITLPDGTHYTLAVFVKDFKGDEAGASKVAAAISAAVYSSITENPQAIRRYAGRP